MNELPVLASDRGSLLIELTESREMTTDEIEAVAMILFQWWKREHERERDEATQEKA